tara:strand:+ start:885 stop:1190 length:306 start_codon:yes stop_codon:yes gene_type:complete
MLKFALYAAILFLTLGVTIARETLARLGLDSNYLVMGVLALSVTALLAHRNWLLVGVVALLCIVINLPPEMLGGIRIDHDLLIAMLLGVTILPVVHRFIVR